MWRTCGVTRLLTGTGTGGLSRATLVGIISTAPTIHSDQRGFNVARFTVRTTNQGKIQLTQVFCPDTYANKVFHTLKLGQTVYVHGVLGYQRGRKTTGEHTLTPRITVNLPCGQLAVVAEAQLDGDAAEVDELQKTTAKKHRTKLATKLSSANEESPSALVDIVGEQVDPQPRAQTTQTPRPRKSSASGTPEGWTDLVSSLRSKQLKQTLATPTPAKTKAHHTTIDESSTTTTPTPTTDESSTTTTTTPTATTSTGNQDTTTQAPQTPPQAPPSGQARPSEPAANPKRWGDLIGSLQRKRGQTKTQQTQEQQQTNTIIEPATSSTATEPTNTQEAQHPPGTQPQVQPATQPEPTTEETTQSTPEDPVSTTPQQPVTQQSVAATPQTAQQQPQPTTQSPLGGSKIANLLNQMRQNPQQEPSKPVSAPPQQPVTQSPPPQEKPQPISAEKPQPNTSNLADLMLNSPPTAKASQGRAHETPHTRKQPVFQQTQDAIPQYHKHPTTDKVLLLDSDIDENEVIPTGTSPPTEVPEKAKGLYDMLFYTDNPNANSRGNYRH
eukprot:TRINITY_DN57765_c0_g2_i1.p1 TRINITY_DN57765_c0_g2~~TRINITY_DN57765_c0_g2_i1.p1  ORF type:complete len:555 (+),score=100.06 TRINITY_DN57765_c0_g2_i1:50-1714(+)